MQSLIITGWIRMWIQRDFISRVKMDPVSFFSEGLIWIKIGLTCNQILSLRFEWEKCILISH